MVYQHVDKKNLFDHMKSICLLYQKKIMDFPGYQRYMDTSVSKPHHIPNYIALLSNKSSCADIATADTSTFKTLLKDCVQYYKSGVFKNCISNFTQCSGIAKSQCRNHSVLTDAQDMSRMFYNVFYYLADSTFVNDVSQLKTTLSVDFIGDWWSAMQSDFSKPLYTSTLENLDKSKYGEVKIVAFELNDIKFFLFQSAILTQSAFIIIAIILVVVFIWFFSGSLFIALMTLGCIIFALLISYFVYGRIFNMNFFPFLNMVTLIFIVGIGADDAFVYTGIWEEAKQVYKIKQHIDHVEYLIKWTTHTLRHALLAMLVTSLTTAAAFYANVSSSINSVKCFGLYAGTSIIVNYLLMVTVFPVVVIIHEKYLGNCMHSCCPGTCKTRPYVETETIAINNSMSSKVQNFLDKVSHKLFNEILPRIMKKLKYIFIVFFLGIGIGGCVITFAQPGLQPPNTESFQMFKSSSSLEQWGNSYKTKFAFSAGKGGWTKNAYFVFGVQAIDNGYYFDPNDKGKLLLNNGVLDIAKVQVWLNQFCINLRAAPFYSHSSTCTLIEQMFVSYTQSCTGNDTCCGKNLPLPDAEFMDCFADSISTVSARAGIYQPLYDTNNKLRTFVISMTSTYKYTDNYQINDKLYNTFNSWFKEQLKNVTSKSFENGWWHVELTFYDLQKSLAEGTKQSLGM